MKIFITGGTGFIGSYLIKKLLSYGHELLCLKRKSSSLYRLNDVKDHITWVNIEEDWKESFKIFAPEIVYNLAWSGVSAKDRVVWAIQIENILLQQQLLDLSLACHVKKFVGIGSQSEYGDFEEKVDESFPLAPKTAYAAAKVASLDILRSFCQINQIQGYWFRVFAIFGPYEGSNWLIPSMVKKMLSDVSMDFTPGEQRIPYLYVGECANALASAAEDKREYFDVEEYNISGNNPQALRDMITQIRDFVCPSFQLNFGAMSYRYGQSMYMEGNTDKLAQDLYAIDNSHFEDRLQETIKYYLKEYGK